MSKSTGLPGEGYYKDEAERANYLALSPAQKKDYMQQRRQQVYAFARWEQMLLLAKDFCKYYI